MALVVDKNVLSPLRGLGTVVKHRPTIRGEVSVPAVYATPRVPSGVLRPVLHYFNDHSSAGSFKVGKCESSDWSLFRDCLGCSGPLAISREPEDWPISVGKAFGIPTGTARNL